jgi:hypothetical protein
MVLMSSIPVLRPRMRFQNTPSKQAVSIGRSAWKIHRARKSQSGVGSWPRAAASAAGIIRLTLNQNKILPFSFSSSHSRFQKVINPRPCFCIPPHTSGIMNRHDPRCRARRQERGCKPIREKNPTYKTYKAKRHPNPSVSSRPLLCPLTPSRQVRLPLDHCPLAARFLNPCEMQASNQETGRSWCRFVDIYIFSTTGVMLYI